MPSSKLGITPQRTNPHKCTIGRYLPQNLTMTRKGAHLQKGSNRTLKLGKHDQGEENRLSVHVGLQKH